uniref:Apple domain-containing protein n=1 Tax=Panagrellus redivivus TaxID=6233 RepID=A0A7E4VEV8_PANRE
MADGSLLIFLCMFPVLCSAKAEFLHLNGYKILADLLVSGNTPDYEVCLLNCAHITPCVGFQFVTATNTCKLLTMMRNAPEAYTCEYYIKVTSTIDIIGRNLNQVEQTVQNAVYNTQTLCPYGWEIVANQCFLNVNETICNEYAQFLQPVYACGCFMTITMSLLILVSGIIYGTSACMPMKPPDGVISLPMIPETSAMTTSIPVTTSTATTTTTTSGPICPAPANTAPFLADDEFRHIFNSTLPFLNLTTYEESTCTRCADGTVGFFKSAASPYVSNTDDIEAVLTVPPTICSYICVCKKSGECYTRSPGTSSFYLYSYCDNTNCGMYVVLTSDGSFVPVGGTGKTYVPDIGFTNPVTNGDVYINAATISCTKCVKTTCI